MTREATPESNDAFLATERQLRQNRAIIALALGVILMPLGAVMDWMLYPDSFSSLLLVRLIATAILGVGLWLIKSGELDSAFELVSLLLIFAPAAALVFMIWLTDGSQSNYYFGLILLMIVVHLLGFRTGEAITYCVATVLIYLLAVFCHPQLSETPPSLVAQGIFFLITSAVVCIAVCHVNRAHRFTAFNLQNELRNEQQQLKESMQRLRETESRLFQSEKMRAIAGVASGLLHEINNPVNFSLMAIRVLKKSITESSEAETLGDIEDGVQRIGEIVSDLRSFAHPEQHAQQEPFCLRSAIQKAERFSANEVELGTIQISDDAAIDSVVMGSVGQITQVFLNLVLNASHAIAKQSHVTVPAINISAKEQDGRLFVTVSDNGIGMNDEQIARIREPFFTTRTGEGLGLGLSICETIIHTHDGQLSVESSPGSGTRITFDLGMAEQSSPADTRVSTVESQTSSSESITRP